VIRVVARRVAATVARIPAAGGVCMDSRMFDRLALAGLLSGVLATVAGGAVSAAAGPHRSPHGPLRGVMITFVNATAADITILDLPHASRTVRPQEQFITKTGQQVLVDFLTAKGVTYSVSGYNPAIGLPGMVIVETKSGTVVFDRAMGEGERVDSGLFIVERLTDTRTHKSFRLTVQP
jgi:hypothetical protein